ncbi:hypothetical protein L6164_011566 [Bauhinia variegata]|uniref:Uncharacterized protein n=1 Tax=Bauhinia variegata TaxID=167791 RepID=A0ACB9P8I6_BAUVA|nr:hypothetical protein L6164_011566 [Bauhinia variegata]
MASATVTLSFGFRCLPLRSSPACVSCGSIQLAPFSKANAVKLTSSSCISGFGSILPQKLCTVAPRTQRLQPLTVVSAKGYKMKTHKVCSSVPPSLI